MDLGPEMQSFTAPLSSRGVGGNILHDGGRETEPGGLQHKLASLIVLGVREN